MFSSATRNWRSALKESVMRVGSFILKLKSDVGGLVSDPAGIELLS